MKTPLVYRRCAEDPSVETADWSGPRTRALAPHFHGDVQVAFVVRGVRRFVILGARVEVPAGFALAIAPFVAHRAEPDNSSDTISTNFYLPGPVVAVCGWVVARFSSADPAAARDLAVRLPKAGRDCFLEAAVPALDLGVGQAARALGLSREHFTRRFAATTGLAPQAYALCRRLDSGRVRLQEGRVPVEAALDAGFADQSHFGRAFMRHFGTSPGRYRRAMTGSHPF